jgi:hypothetical protein
MRLVRRTAAVTVMAVVTSGAVIGVASANEGRTRTGLDIAVAHQSIAPGESDVVHGWLHTFTRHPHGLGGRQVDLVERTPKTHGWTTAATATTGRRGFVHFDITPPATTRYALVFHRTNDLRATRSRDVTVFVGQPTALTISVASTSIDPGQSDTVSGVLTSNSQPLAGQTIELRARTRPHHHGHTIASATTGSDGSVSFTVTPATSTSYRLLFRRTADHQRALSDPATVSVRKPTSLSIRARDDSVKSGGTDVISGVLLTGKRPLPHQLVTLQSRPAGTSGWSDVASMRTGKRGFVAFKVQPSAATDYQLVFGATPRFESCHSGVVTIGVT